MNVLWVGFPVQSAPDYIMGLKGDASVRVPVSAIAPAAGLSAEITRATAAEAALRALVVSLTAAMQG